MFIVRLHFVFFQANLCLLSVYILRFSRSTDVYCLFTFCVFPSQLVFIVRLHFVFFQANLRVVRLGSPLNIIIVTISIMRD